MRKAHLYAATLSLLALGTASAQNFKWDQAKGQQIRVLLNQHPWTNAITPHIPEFEKLTGIKVNVETFPEAQFRQKVLVELASGTGAVDAFMLTPNQEGLLYSRSGWLEPLSAYVKNPKLTPANWSIADFFPATVKAGTINNQLIGIPIQMETTMLFYRKDLFDKYNVKVPTTFAELEAAAKALHGKDGVSGIGLRGKGASATSQFAPYMFGFGGNWLTKDGKSNFSDPKVVRALDYYTGLLRNAGPQGATSMSWQETTQLFSQGKLAMFTDASVFRSVVDDPKNSTVAGKVGFAPFPAGPAGRTPTVLAWTLAIPKASQKKDAAWLFTQWASNQENQVRVLLAEVPATRQSAWKASAFTSQDKNPQWTKANMDQLKFATPVWNPPVTSVGEVRDVLGQAIVSAIQGGNSRQLLEKATRDTNAIIEKEK